LLFLVVYIFEKLFLKSSFSIKQAGLTCIKVSDETPGLLIIRSVILLCRGTKNKKIAFATCDSNWPFIKRWDSDTIEEAKIKI